MPGIATQFEILRLTIERLEIAGDPDGIARIMQDNEAYAHLGAVGPLLGDMLPSDPFPLNEPFPEDYPTLWRRVFHLIGRRDPPGLWPILQELNELLNTIGTIANNNDCDALRNLNDTNFEERITQVTQNFATAVSTIQTEALQIAGIIGEGLKPNVNTENSSDPVPPPNSWQMRDFLHWKRPGIFIKSLLNTADEKGDDRLRAYAYGYLVSYAGNVCGNGHINSIVGGPARTQWWRQRFVKNYVDAWVYGFYNQSSRPSFSGDMPMPAYESGEWPNLCSANLQSRIQLADLDPAELLDLAARVRPFPQVIPDDFALNWFTAVEAAYGGNLPEGVNANALNSAYIFTWLVLWFQTSGTVLGCDPSIPPEPPDGCGDSPSELDPFVNGVPIDGNIPQPPAPEIDYDTDELAIICGIILAVIGGILIGSGNVALGGAAIGGAVALLDCDSVVDLDWKKLRCLVYWERMYLHNALKGIHRLLTISALDYPYMKELAIDQDFQDLFPFLEPWESGKNLTKSKSHISFPSKPWDGSLLSFNRPPTDFETPQTIAYRNVGYPDFFIDDDINNPLSNGDIRTAMPVSTAADGGAYESENTKEDTHIPVQFGNAVANAVDLFEHLASNYPNWNLDADRGLAYLTWKFAKDKYEPNDVNVGPEF